MSFRPNPTQLPVLCNHCRGPMDLDDQFGARCSYCGAEDRLPADRLDRALELKGRLEQATRAHGQLGAIESALIGFYETRHGLTMNRLGLALIAVWGLHRYFIDFLPSLLQASNDQFARQAGLAALSVGTFVAIPVGLWSGLTIGRLRFQRTLRPQLLARPPLPGGVHSRCRVCHAELPETRAPVVRCVYCNSLSLLSPEHHGVAKRRALVEEVRLREKGRAVLAEAKRSGNRLRFELAITWAGATVAVTACLMLIAFVLR